MKRIRMIELLAEIKVNVVAFVSVCMFVCLGIGLFYGIQWGGMAMKKAAEEVFDQGKMHDIEIQFPYGLVDSDLEQLEEVEGVSDVEAGYASYSSFIDGSASYVVKFQSLTNRIDVPINVDGVLPDQEDEVAILRSWAEGHDVGIGDELTFKHDTTDEEDTDGMEYLNSDTFKVTALVDHPDYLSKIAGTLGVASIGSGDVDFVAFVPTEAFDVDKFEDGYPVVYLRCDGLRGANTFSAAYQDPANAIVDEVTELGSTLATARYNDLHDEAQGKIDDAQQQVDEANQQIAEGESKYSEGEQQISEGEQQLADAQQQLSSGKQQLDEGGEQLAQGRTELNNAKTTAQQEKAKAQSELNSAKSTLDASQKKYDESLAEFNAAKSIYDTINNTFNSIAGYYDAAIDNYNTLVALRDELQNEKDALDNATNAYVSDPTEANWPAVQSAYDTFANTYVNVIDTYASLISNASTVAAAYGTAIPVEGTLPALVALSVPASGLTGDPMQGYIDTLSARLDAIAAMQVTVEGQTYHLTDVRSALATAGAKLDAAQQELNAAKQQLDAGWASYNAAVAEFNQKSAEADRELAQGEDTLDQKQSEYDEAKATYEEKLSEYESGEKDIEQAKADLEEARKTLDEKEAELSDANAQLDKAKEKLAGMVEYEWIVFSRLESGGVQNIDSVTSIMGNVCWAMASLFVLVGLFVCYSAVSRLVYDEVTQIGAKKALGFHEGEITFMYLSFSGIAVLVGTLLASAMAILMVQGIMNPVAASSFTLPSYPPYVSLPDLLVGGGIEMVLILLSTWLAAHGLLKRNAVDLLSGDQQTNAKEHVWERTKLWQGMSLFSQTVVNNCINDKRRVAATLIGVTGCTALIVTAITLANNVAHSFERQYEDIYGFDTLVYLDTRVDGALDSVTEVLDDYGLTSAPAHVEKLQVRQPNGYRSSTMLFVPTDPASFDEVYHLLSLSGEPADINADGIWISAAYAEHMHVGAGDEVRVTEGTGRTHAFTVAGVFECYVLRNEFVLSKANYVDAFGAEPTTNVILANKGKLNLDKLREALLQTDGYDTLVDDYTNNAYGFNELATLLNTVVLVYLMLSALMAVVVLLNLDIMFVTEKKRELIVLMINGFSARSAKAYIYRDSIALTIIGILLGVVFGALMGSMTIGALEPSYGYFIKAFNWLASGVGIVGSALFSAAVLLWSLRMIPRFDLTDINRF